MADMTGPATGRLTGPLFTECAEWIWEQLQEDGVYLAGELIELVLTAERELNVHTRPLPEIARMLDEEFRTRAPAGSASALDPRVIHMILEWEDDFLGFAQLSRAES